MNKSDYTLREIDFDEWESLWPSCENQNILQSWFYGEAKKKSDNLQVFYFVAEDSFKPVSMAQVLVKKLPIKGGIARINRAPLKLDHSGPSHDQIILDTIELIITECNRRWWLMLQIAPEIENDEIVENRLKEFGLKKISSPSWASAVMDLNDDEDILLSSLKGKWRNCLRKGWKLGVEANRYELNDQQVIAGLVATYKKLQQKNDFIGLSPEMIKNMASKKHEYWKFNIFYALSKNGEGNQGLLVSVHHGNTAIYLIGSSTDEGRNNQCNYVLLWEAIRYAKLCGCQNYDIGGLDQTTPKGIAHFKKGLNAIPYKLSGEWRGFFYPKIF